MHFGFALQFSDIDLWNTDLVDTHLDLLYRDKYTDIPNKYFGRLHKIFKRSSRQVFKTSSRYVFKASSRHVFKTSSRHVFKASSICLNCCCFIIKLVVSIFSLSKTFWHNNIMISLTLIYKNSVILVRELAESLQ